MYQHIKCLILGQKLPLYKKSYLNSSRKYIFLFTLSIIVGPIKYPFGYLGCLNYLPSKIILAPSFSAVPIK